MESNRFQDKDVDLTQDEFLKELVRELSGVLQDLVGLEAAKGLIAIVGSRIGDRLDGEYKAANDGAALDREGVAAASVDLKSRIDGDFYVIEQSDDEIVLGNRRCPFGKAVEGRPAMCMMTSNVFGRIAAENLGYAQVSVDEAFATGHGRCLIRIGLTPPAQGEAAEGREYFKTGDADG